MHESERNRLRKLKEVLILAGKDMDQAHAAATALRVDLSDDESFRRALETAMAVCYMRPFTRSSLMTLPNEYVPTTWPDADLHAGLKNLRNEVYAHTDKDSGRTASMKAMGKSGDTVTLEWREEWLAFPIEDIPAALSLFVRQQNRFLIDAVSIHVELNEDV